MNEQNIVEVLEEYLSVTDEWGGTKLAGWKWGNNVCVAGIEDAAHKIMELAQQSITRYRPSYAYGIGPTFVDHPDGEFVKFDEVKEFLKSRWELEFGAQERSCCGKKYT